MSAPVPVSDPLAAYRITEAPYYRPCSGEVALYQHAYAHRLPLILKGPTGCGKTRFVEYMAWKLGRPLVTLACNEDMTAADLVGRWLLDADGTRWHDGPLTLAARHGAICYLDEVVEARQDTTVVIHPLTDARRMLPLDRTALLRRLSGQLGAATAAALAQAYPDGPGGLRELATDAYFAQPVRRAAERHLPVAESGAHERAALVGGQRPHDVLARAGGLAMELAA